MKKTREYYNLLEPRVPVIAELTVTVGYFRISVSDYCLLISNNKVI